MKILKLTLFLGMIFLFACENLPDPVVSTFSESFFVRFDGTSSNVTEGDEATLTIYRSTNDLSSDEVISFSASAVFRDTGADASSVVSLTETQVTIPAGETKVDFTVSTVENFDEDGVKDVTLTIESSSSGLNLGTPGPDQIERTHVLSILDDDCPYNINNFVGTFDVTENSTNYGTQTYSAAISLGGAPNTLIVEAGRWWDWTGAGAVTIQFNPTTFEVTVPTQSVNPTIGSGVFTGTLDLDAGEILTCDNSFTLNYRMVFGSGSLIDTVTDSRFTKQ